jgi:hypothetical protein
MAHEHYSRWLTTAHAHGISPFEAGKMPQAQEAHDKDRAEEVRARASATKEDFLTAFMGNRVKEGGPKGFADQEEMLAAMSAPEYDTSEAYRQAVAEVMKFTPAEVVGVSAIAKSSDGTVLELGRQQQSDVASVDSMLTNAHRDMVIEEMGKLNLGSAKGRYEYMQMLADPKNADAVAYMQGLVTSDEQAARNSMLDSQSRGQIARYVTPVSNAVDQPEGTLVTEERS